MWKNMLILEAVDELIPMNLISFFFCISIVLAHCKNFCATHQIKAGKSHFSVHVSLMYNVY